MAIYYVDSVNGNDKNSGLSSKEAFFSLEKINDLEINPGDKVLLKRNSVFYGHLKVSASGTEENPIYISSYGEGFAKPCINVNDGSEYGICITGEYITVNDIEVTNPDGKIGIQLFSEMCGATHVVVVSNCYIHDVGTNNKPDRLVPKYWGHDWGGISVETTRKAPTWYENTRIENNRIERVNRTGIWFAGQWFNRFKNSFAWTANKATGMNDTWYPHKNIYISWNVVDHSYGDGIIGVGCKNLVMEHNKVFYANFWSVRGDCSAGLWSMCCDGALIQYNEVAYTGKKYGADGEAFDIDNCSRDTIVQYNYSHDNEGGFILICNITCNSKKAHNNHIIRNNLSVNDGDSKNYEQEAAIFNFTGVTQNVSILNNTIYYSSKNRFRLFEVADYAQNGAPQDVLVANNIFYSEHKDNYNHFQHNGLFTFDSNLFFNMPELPSKDTIKEINTYNLNPVWTGKGCVPGSRLAVEAFVPTWRSPLLRLGKYFEDCADKDYMGIDTRNHNYIGAFYYKDANIG